MYALCWHAHQIKIIWVAMVFFLQKTEEFSYRKEKTIAEEFFFFF